MPLQNSRESPRRSATASVTASSALRPANNVLIWNVRASPRRTRSCGPSAVMSSPARKICPALGATMPVIRLMSVVLPAPFGPISATRAPTGSSISIPRRTGSEPNAFDRLRVANAGGRLSGALILPPPPIEVRQATENAVGKHHHDCHQQHADPEIPVLRRDPGELVARDHEDHGAHQPAVKPA